MHGQSLTDALRCAARSLRRRQPIKFCGVGEKLVDLEPFYPSA